jgi:hypothetical protein
MTPHTLSRRHFLRLAGLTLLAAQVPLPSWAQSRHALTARALTATLIYSAASPSLLGVEVVQNGYLWPDSLVTIEAALPGWYRLSGGYVPTDSLQPMQPYTPDPHSAPASVGTPIRLSGPSASVREWCAADAPLVARLGHGAVVYVVDYLPDDHSGWYGVTDGSRDLLGWTPAVLWAAVTTSAAPSVIHHLELDRAGGQATLYAGAQPVLQTACAIGDQLAPGMYPIQRCSLTSWHGSRHAIPHTLAGEGFRLHGVYWHNRFGLAQTGSTVELPTLAASALYDLLDEKSHVLVV